MAVPLESQGLFEAQGIKVHYTGIGKINATIKLMELLKKASCRRVVNLGTAGSHWFPMGTLIECQAFVQRDMDLTMVGFPLGVTPGEKGSGKIMAQTFSDYQKGVCGSGDSLEQGIPRLDCDLMDMEAYALAKVCKIKNIDFHCFKFITDRSDHHTKVDWQSLLKVSAETLLKVYKEIVSEI